MSTNLSVTEPHPTVPSGGAYIGSARGGAGNFRRYKTDSLTTGPDATGPASRINLRNPFKRSAAVIPTGRGGAGNMFKAPDPEECIFQFDEEMIKRRDVQAPVYHIGRGGAANFVDEREEPSPMRRTDSSESSGSLSSDDSTSSQLRGTINKLVRRFS